MSELQTLQAKAAQAERLAWCLADRDMADRLRALAREYKAKAEALREKLPDSVNDVAIDALEYSIAVVAWMTPNAPP